jgi:hypothetical protein
MEETMTVNYVIDGAVGVVTLTCVAGGTGRHPAEN